MTFKKEGSDRLEIRIERELLNNEDGYNFHSFVYRKEGKVFWVHHKLMIKIEIV